jgi:hypothetical protein
MTSSRKFANFLDRVLKSEFERLYSLEYPAPERNEDVAAHSVRAQKRAANWAGHVWLRTGMRDQAARIIVTEARPDGSFLFHIFLAGCDWKKFGKANYCFQWYSGTTGGAQLRRYQGRPLRGLLHHFVMELDCPMDIVTPLHSPNHTYRRADFR